MLTPRSETQVGTNSETVLNFYLTLHILAGHILLPILAFIFLFRITRHPTLINLCLASIVHSICACILLYTQTQIGPQPPFAVCYAQAALVSGIQPLQVLASQALVYQVWSSIFYPRTKWETGSVWQAVRSSLLITLPWLAFAVWITAAVVIGLQNQSTISRDRRFFYCSIDVKSFTAISIFCAVNLLVMMALQISISINIWRNWRVVKKALERGEVNKSMVIRVICFEVYVFIGLILSFLSIQAPKSPIPDLWLASIGLFIVLVFGTQVDVWNVLKTWPRWRPATRASEPKVDLLA